MKVLYVVTAIIGLLLLIASIWAGQYIVHCCGEEWYAISAIFTIWIIRALAVFMMILPIDALLKS